MDGVEVVLSIFSDESEDSHVTTLAGWISTPYGWELFKERWRAMLAEFGASEFHTVDLMATKNPGTEYSPWPQGKRDAFLEAAIQIIEKNEEPMFSVACSIATNAALRRQSEYWAWKQAFATIGAFSYGLNPTATHAQFVFDEKEKVRGFVEEAYKAAREQDRDFERWSRDRKPQFESSLKVLPLQAADLLAWSLRRSVSKRLNGYKWPLPWVERLKLGSQRHRWRCVDYDDWRLIKEAVDAGMPFHKAWSTLVVGADPKEY